MIKSHKRKEYLIFGSPLIEEPEIQEVVDTLRSGWLGTGPKVSKFEDIFKEYTGAKFAFGLTHGWDPLHCGSSRNSKNMGICLH